MHHSNSERILFEQMNNITGQRQNTRSVKNLLNRPHTASRPEFNTRPEMTAPTRQPKPERHIARDNGNPMHQHLQQQPDF